MTAQRIAACLVLTLLVVACGDEPEPAARPVRHYDADGKLLIAHETKQRPNLVLVVVEGLRADALPDDRWPSKMDVLRCDNAVAPSPRPVPSLVSLLTGLLPSAHACDTPGRPPALLSAVTTFPEALSVGHGYETVAITIGRWPGGFDSVLQGFETVIEARETHRAVLKINDWTKQRKAERPYLLLLHVDVSNATQGDPEADPPQVPERLPADPLAATVDFLVGHWRAAYIEKFGYRYERAVNRYRFEGFAQAPDPSFAKRLRDAYEDRIMSLDVLMRFVNESLRVKPYDEATILVVTSTNGQAFGEHGTLGAGLALYDELVHVPLFVGAWESLNNFNWGGGVGIIDVFPTFFELAGLPPMQGVHGRSFLEAANAGGAGRPVFSEERLERENTGVDVRRVLTSVRSPRFKYVITYDRVEGTVLESAFDLQADPEERNDLAKGTGRIDGLVFDASFCETVEQARDRIWGAAEGAKRRLNTPYASGESQVTSKRPEPCR